MFVALRPGPYVCGEWDFGGIPTNLLINKSLIIRNLSDTNYVTGFSAYITALAQHVKNLMIPSGGNILMI